MNQSILTGLAGEPVYVRLNEHILGDVREAQAKLQAEAPFATISRADALRECIIRGAQNLTAVIP